jgi:hypothetical protein
MLRKLRFDLEQLKKHPTNGYFAFNFFVTAEHMKDWLYPGYPNNSKREQLEKSSTLLQVCSHVANGAKHFMVEAKHHKSVTDTRRTGGYFPRGYFPSNYSPSGYFASGSLTVELQGDAQKELGARITAVELAERVLGFWESRPELVKSRAEGDVRLPRRLGPRHDQGRSGAGGRAST